MLCSYREELPRRHPGSGNWFFDNFGDPDGAESAVLGVSKKVNKSHRTVRRKGPFHPRLPGLQSGIIPGVECRILFRILVTPWGWVPHLRVTAK